MNKERKLKKLKKAMNLLYGREAMNLLYGRKGLRTGFQDIHGREVYCGSLIKHIRYVGGACVEDSTEVSFYNKVTYFPTKASFGVVLDGQFVPLYALVNVEVI